MYNVRKKTGKEMKELLASIANHDLAAFNSALEVIKGDESKLAQLRDLVTQCKPESPLFYVYDQIATSPDIELILAQFNENLLGDTDSENFDITPYIEALLRKDKECPIALLSYCLLSMNVYIECNNTSLTTKLVDLIIDFTATIIEERLRTIAYDDKELLAVINYLNLSDQALNYNQNPGLVFSESILKGLFTQLSALPVLIPESGVYDYRIFVGKYLFSRRGLDTLESIIRRPDTSATWIDEFKQVVKQYLLTARGFKTFKDSKNSITRLFARGKEINSNEIWREIIDSPDIKSHFAVTIMHATLCPRPHLAPPDEEITLSYLREVVPDDYFSVPLHKAVAQLFSIQDSSRLHKEYIILACTLTDAGSTPLLLKRKLYNIFSLVIAGQPITEARITQTLNEIIDHTSDQITSFIIEGKLPRAYNDGTSEGISLKDLVLSEAKYPQAFEKIKLRCFSAAEDATNLAIKNKEWEKLTQMIKQYKFMFDVNIMPSKAVAINMLNMSIALYKRKDDASTPLPLHQQFCELVQRAIALADITETEVIKAAYDNARKITGKTGKQLQLDTIIGGPSGRSALTASCEQNNFPMTRHLLSLGADAQGQEHIPDLENKDGLYRVKILTPLMAAVRNGNMEIVSLLIENGASISYYLKRFGLPKNHTVFSHLFCLIETSGIKSITLEPYLEILKLLLTQAQTFRHPIFAKLPSLPFLIDAIKTRSKEVLQVLYEYGFSFEEFRSHLSSVNYNIDDIPNDAIRVFFEFYTTTLGHDELESLYNEINECYNPHNTNEKTRETLREILDVFAKTIEIPILIRQFHHRGIPAYADGLINKIISCIRRGADPCMRVNRIPLPFHILIIKDSMQKTAEYLSYCELTSLPSNSQGETLLEAAVRNQHECCVIVLLRKARDQLPSLEPCDLMTVKPKDLINEAYTLASNIRPDGQPNHRGIVIYLKLLEHVYFDFFRVLRDELFPAKEVDNHFMLTDMHSEESHISISDINRLHEHWLDAREDKKRRQYAPLLLGLCLSRHQQIEHNWMLLMHTNLRKLSQVNAFGHTRDDSTKTRFNCKSICRALDLPFINRPKSAHRSTKETRSLKTIAYLHQHITKHHACGPVITLLQFLTLKDATRFTFTSRTFPKNPKMSGEGINLLYGR